MLYPALRPFLFALDAENAHELTLAALKRAHGVGLVGGPPATATTGGIEVMGLRFPNRVGLAAGLDKNGECIDALASLGFGFLEVGTVTPRAQPGNPRPRLFRLPGKRAIINRMGFNNHGVDALLANVQAARYRGILGINIGKNADTPIAEAADDYLACLRKVYAAASYVTVNISSPNTKNLRSLQGGDELTALLGALKVEQDALAQHHGRYVPMAVKIAPDLDDAQIQTIADTIRATRMDGVIATNTTLSRVAVTGLPHADETGGLSGEPVFEPSTEVLRKLVAALGGEVPVIGVGGIMSGRDARAKLDAGAQLVQIYTGLIYRGPDLVGECVRALARHS